VKKVASCVGDVMANRVDCNEHLVLLQPQKNEGVGIGGPFHFGDHFCAAADAANGY